VMDQILHPWSGPLLSIPEAIAALGSDFEIRGSSPQFITDWRWYKDIHGEEFAFNASAAESYARNVHNFVDYRYNMPERKSGGNTELGKVCDEIYRKQFASERGEKAYSSSEVAADVAHVINCLEGSHPQTLAALKDFVNCVRSENVAALSEFRSLWGRGQQYLSFIRNN
jgi:hypothetical protein